MGVLYEFNWFLVVGDENDCQLIDQNTYSTVKNDKRIYPVNAPMPFIVKNVGCIGMIEVSSFMVNGNSTSIKFNFIERYDVSSVIASHYYGLYLAIKQSNSN